MSDAEKKVIDLLKNIDKQKCMMLECPVVKNNIERQLKIIELNRTIRKQSKEIEELKSIFGLFKNANENAVEIFRETLHLENYISKDKIKAKIEELEKRQNDLKEMPDDVARSIGLEDCQEKIILYKELLEKE